MAYNKKPRFCLGRGLAVLVFLSTYTLSRSPANEEHEYEDNKDWRGQKCIHELILIA